MLHLAFDLLNDSTIASRRALDSLEYTSVLLVGMIVTVFGFVPGQTSLPLKPSHSAQES
jgi:MFS superfamily sulfate permease-like transporter